MPGSFTSVPTGSKGLPVGTMLVGRAAEEATLVALSAQVEAARRGRTATPTDGI
jgi:Asp-tRNA(Asn)/Glu-tRNA(Gln) amidotransferase A subunit family amidase